MMAPLSWRGELALPKHNIIYLEWGIEFGALGGVNKQRIEATKAVKQMRMKEDSHLGEAQTMQNMCERGVIEDKPAHTHHNRHWKYIDNDWVNAIIKVNIDLMQYFLRFFYLRKIGHFRL